MKRRVLGVVLAAMCISVAPVSAYAAAGNSGVQDVLSKIADAVSDSGSEGTADAAADAQTETTDTTAAVSYTHLDVYKRQGYGSL